MRLKFECNKKVFGVFYELAMGKPVFPSPWFIILLSISFLSSISIENMK